MSDSNLPYGVDFVGPFVEEWRITLDGFRVPHLTAHPEPDGRWSLHLDGRFCLPHMPREEVERWVWFLANAMAVAGGYSCFGENSVHNPNPFKVGMRGLSSAPSGDGPKPPAMRLVEPEDES